MRACAIGDCYWLREAYTHSRTCARVHYKYGPCTKQSASHTHVRPRQIETRARVRCQRLFAAIEMCLCVRVFSSDEDVIRCKVGQQIKTTQMKRLRGPVDSARRHFNRFIDIPAVSIDIVFCGWQRPAGRQSERTHSTADVRACQCLFYMRSAARAPSLRSVPVPVSLSPRSAGMNVSCTRAPCMLWPMYANRHRYHVRVKCMGYKDALPPLPRPPGPLRRRSELHNFAYTPPYTGMVYHMRACVCVCCTRVPCKLNQYPRIMC